MAETSEIIKEFGRIKYIEPNDVYGYGKDENGERVPLTPDYEDLCIAFNLIIEMYDRIDIQNRNEIGLMWTDKLYVESNSEKDVPYTVPYTSVVDGGLIDNEGHRYLSTYYTEITPEGYSKTEQIEGLGVENIQVSFDSYYTPTVNIKFIDVKGSALFGREEAIHTDSSGSGRIHGKNIFGAFMTQPFPKFKLQMKGFYGKDVTYQLAVSNFTANFNAKTGNVEANVSFVGYTWSLLTDIPFIYLVAAPYCNYVGENYWNTHVSLPEWRMVNSEVISGLSQYTEPPTLVTLFNVISDALKNTNESYIGANASEIAEQVNATLTDLNEKIGQYNVAKTNNNEEELEELYNSIKSTLENDSLSRFEFGEMPSTDTSTTSNSSLSFGGISIKNKGSMSKADWGDCVNKILSKYEELNGLASKSNVLNNVDANLINFNPDRYNIETLESALVENFKFSTIIWEAFVNIGHNYRFREYTGYSNFYYWLTSSNSTTSTTTTTVTTYPDLSDLKSNVESALLTVNDDINNEIETANREFIISTIRNLNIDPNIYNIFKILMCHLETFVHILFEAGSEIRTQMNDGLRTPELLGVTFKKTDLPSRMEPNRMEKDKDPLQLPPWTAVTNEDDDNNINQECEIEYANSYRWVGSLNAQNRWVEERVVWSLQNAIQKIQPLNNDNVGGDSDTRQEDVIPTLPSDVLSNVNIFSALKGGRFDSICGNLGFRLTQLLGIFDTNASDDIIKEMAELDAYNYYMAMFSVDDIKTSIIENTSKGDATELIEGIISANDNYVNYGTKYDGNGNQSYVFEYEPIINNNQPVLNNTNNGFEYTYMKDKSNNCIVPANFINFSSDKETYRQFAEYVGNGVFEGVVNNIDNKKVVNNWLCSNDTQLDGIVNDKMFSLITREEDVRYIKEWYSRLKGDSMRIKEYSTDKNYQNFIDRYWKVSYDDFKKRVATTYEWNCFGYKNEKRGDIITSLGGEKYIKSNKIKDWINVVIGEDSTHNYKLSDEENIFICDNNTYGIDDLYLKELSVKSAKDTKKTNFDCAFFACPLYYRQNAPYPNLTDEQNKLRTLEAKAFLFLQALPRTANKLSLDFTNHGGFAIWSKVNLLYIGGLLYRQQFYDENKISLVLSADENGIEYRDTNHKELTIGDSEGLRYYTTKEELKNYSNEYITYDKYIGSINDNIKSQLIEEFKKFARDTNGFVKFIEECELKDSNGQYFAGKKAFNKFVEKNPDKIIDKNNVYDAYYFSNTGLHMVFKEDSTTEFINQFVKDICFGQVIVCFDSKVPNSKKDGSIVISKSKVDTYLSTFVDTLTKIHSGTTTVETEYSSTGLTENIDVDESVLLSIYLYCKNLWEKWLLPKSGRGTSSIKIEGEDYYDVKNFFTNFIFIDTYYNEIGSKLKINLDIFYDKYISRSKDGSLFSFIGDIVGEHRCLFVGLPDYIDLGMGESDLEKQREAIRNMENMFRPLPFSKMGVPRNDNHFVTIYTYPPASKLPEDYSYRYDGWDLWSYDDVKGLFETANKQENTDSPITQFGYNIPAFGVAFGRQSNHLFKEFSINMNNPVQTEESLKALQNVAEMANGNNRKICFYGQDVYNIYSNYSYQIEVEMMGNAQIQPLMYFQLSNIPMWRGMYMIFNVSHTMTPGNMSTRFKGMKMTRYPVPILSKYWSFMPESNIFGPTYGDGFWGGFNISEFDNLPSAKSPREDYLKKNHGTAKIDNLDSNIRELFNSLYEEIMYLPENGSKGNISDMTWNIYCTSAYRPGDPANKDHRTQGTIDVKVAKWKNGEMNPVCDTGDAQKELYTVLALIRKNHMNLFNDENKQHILIEYPSKEVFANNKNSSAMSMLHISLDKGSGTGVCGPFIVAIQIDGHYRYAVNNLGHWRNTSEYLSHLHPSLLALCAADYNSLNRSGFNQIWKGVIPTSASDETLNTLLCGITLTNVKTGGTKKNISTNNNPGNIMGDHQWEGRKGKKSNGTVIFDSLTNGFRALFINLNNTYLSKGKRSIKDIINTWCPGGSKNEAGAYQTQSATNNYVSIVSKGMMSEGITNATTTNKIFNSSIKQTNRSVLISFARWMCFCEHSYKPANSEIEPGLNLALQSLA